MPIRQTSSALLLLLFISHNLCYGLPELQDTLQSSSDILNHVSLEATTTSIEVSWNVNDGEDGEHREYRVRWEHQNNIRGNLYIDDATKATISGLKPCTEYVVCVTLIDVTGEPTGDTVYRTTSTLNESPRAVTGLQSQTIAPKAIVLSWERPTTACSVTSYRIHYAGVAKWGAHKTHKDVKGVSGEEAESTTRYELQDLLPHSDYSVTVVAYTAGGAGENATVNFTTTESEPSQPVNLKTTKLTSNSITVTWDEPTEKNGILGHYHISWYSDGKRIGSQKESHTTHTIAALSPCVEYEIKVAASTAAGAGDYREITQRTDAGAPSQPLDTSCHLNPDKTVSVTWAKPETSCPITRFKVSRPGNSLEPNAMSTIDVPPSTLTANFSTVPGVPFRVCVAAMVSDAMAGPQACCAPPATLSTSQPQTVKMTKSVPNNSEEDVESSDSSVVIIAVGVSVGVVGIVLFVVAVVGLVWWKKKYEDKRAYDHGSPEEKQLAIFKP